MSIPDESPAPPADAPPEAIPVIEEEATVSTETVPTATVRVRVEARDDIVSIPVSETYDEVSVERVEVNRFVDAASAPWQEGEVFVIPVYETVPVVEQRLLLKEEVRVTRRRKEVQREEQVVLRRETPVFEREERGSSGS